MHSGDDPELCCLLARWRFVLLASCMLVSILLHPLRGSIALAQSSPDLPYFSLDPDSASLQSAETPGDIFGNPKAIAVSHEVLGISSVVNVDAISSGRDLLYPSDPCPILRANDQIASSVYYWSVDRQSVGRNAGDAIWSIPPPCISLGRPELDESLAQEAPADIFVQVWDRSPKVRINARLVDEQGLQLAGNNDDDIDALEFDQKRVKYFSVDALTAGQLGVSPGDILSVREGSSTWEIAWSAEDLGIEPERDDIDALCVDETTGAVLFSLSRDSSSLSSGQYSRLVGGIRGFSAADSFLVIPGTSQFPGSGIQVPYLPAEFVSLLSSDNVDALDCTFGDPGINISPYIDKPDDPNDSFNGVWARTDQPVRDGAAVRTWIWGPSAFTSVMHEAYFDSPGGYREVQYFDKSRMEVTDPSADPDSVWYVTNGLLATELTSGREQVGHNAFAQRDPANVNVAGDFLDPTGITYETMGRAVGFPSQPVGTLLNQRLGRSGSITVDFSLNPLDIRVGYVDTVTNHGIAQPFWDFMNSTGTVYQNGQFIQANLFLDPFFGTGRPITEAYWQDALVAGTRKLVLTQCFERRCLTFTPSNPVGWRVEMGNIGLHYHAWRYPSLHPAPIPTSTPVSTPSPTPTTIPMPTPEPSPTATPTETPAPTPTGTPIPQTPPVKESDVPSVAPGDSIRYTIALYGHPEADGSSQSSIDDPLSALVENVGELNCTTGQCEYDDVSHSVQWRGILNADQPVVLRFSVNVIDQLPSQAPAEIENCADTFDGVQTNTACASTTLLIPEEPTKSVSAEVAQPGDHLHYTITLYGNPDAEHLEGATITDDLSPYVSYLGNLSCTIGSCSYDAGNHTVFWNGLLAAEESVSLTFSVAVPGELPSDVPTELENCATTSVGFVAATTCASTTLDIPDEPEPRIPPTKEVSSTAAQPGDHLHYAITLHGNPLSAVPVESSITDELPDLVAYLGNVSCSSSGCSYDAVDHSILWSGLLTAGEDVTITYSVAVAEELPPDVASQIENCAQTFDGWVSEAVCATTDLEIPETIPTTAMSSEALRTGKAALVCLHPRFRLHSMRGR